MKTSMEYMETDKNRNKTLQKGRTSMITEREIDILEPECVTNIQLNIIIHNKTQTDIHGQEEQLNKGAQRSQQDYHIISYTSKLCLYQK